MAHVAITGATGMIGHALVAALVARGDRVTVITRASGHATDVAGYDRLIEWADPTSQPCPVAALSGADVVVNLMGEPLDQRWTERKKREIHDSRVLGTRNLVASLEAAEPRPRVLVSQSATGFYGARGGESVDESAAPAAGDFLSELCVGWEGEALAARAHDMRVVTPRTGVVLSPSGGALARMLPFFRLGLGGPVAGGDQFVPWIHLDDVVSGLIFCADTDAASGAVNMSAPEPVTNARFSKALGRALDRPAVLPVPGFALQMLYGEMAQTVTTGVRAVPARLIELGYSFSYTGVEQALEAALQGPTESAG